MDIYWKNKVKIIFFIALLSTFLSCKSSKVLSRSEVKEIITKRNPYKLSSKTTVEFDKLGEIKPVKLDLKIGNVKTEVLLKGSQIIHTLENKDTVTVSKVISEVKETTTTEVPKELTWWGKLKKKINTIAIYSLILNIIFVFIKISKLIRKVYLPI